MGEKVDALGRALLSRGVEAGDRVGYGLTEVFPVSVCTPRDIARATSGKPIPLVSVRIAENSEIQARSPALMKGYWNNPMGDRNYSAPCCLWRPRRGPNF